MVVAKIVIIFAVIIGFMIFAPKIYAWFTSSTDNQMDQIAKTNAASAKRAKTRNKKYKV